MLSAEDNAAYEMQMLEISEIMPDKSSVNIDLGQLDFDENTIDGADENHNHFASPEQPAGH